MYLKLISFFFVLQAGYWLSSQLRGERLTNAIAGADDRQGVFVAVWLTTVATTNHCFGLVCLLAGLKSGPSALFVGSEESVRRRAFEAGKD